MLLCCCFYCIYWDVCHFKNTFQIKQATFAEYSCPIRLRGPGRYIFFEWNKCLCLHTNLKWKESKTFDNRKKETKQIWLHKIVKLILLYDLIPYIYIIHTVRWEVTARFVDIDGIVYHHCLNILLIVTTFIYTVLSLTFLSCDLFSNDFYLPVYPFNAYRHLFDLTIIDQICTLHRHIKRGYQRGACYILKHQISLPLFVGSSCCLVMKYSSNFV